MKTYQETTEVVLQMRAKAFSGQGVREHKVLCGLDGSLRVWDSIAGHYTTCHSLSKSAIKRIGKLANEAFGS